MLDFFVIFSKGGIVLFATVKNAQKEVLNKFIRLSILENKNEQFTTESLSIKYALDNEFDLVFIVGYQKILKLAYVDKFLDDIQLAFRDKYNNYNLRNLLLLNESKSCSNADDQDLDLELILRTNVIDFYDEYKQIYTRCYKNYQNQPQAKMRTFEESEKSKKTVSSMIISKAGEKKPTPKEKPKENKESAQLEPSSPMARKILLAKQSTSPKPSKKKKDEKPEKAKKTKENRSWGFSDNNRSNKNLDFSEKVESNSNMKEASVLKNIGGLENVKSEDMKPNLEFDYESDTDESEESDYEEQDLPQRKKPGLFGNFVSSFSYNKPLEMKDIEKVLAQLRDHLIAKNVAAEVAVKLTDSVGQSLIGKRVNTWIGLKAFVKSALEESILRILSPNRNVNILSDIRSKESLPYVIAFCGVNGVGKSTNLAKIANWLITNNVKVLVIACDTFRAGAIEQLKTHVTALKTIHENDGSLKIKLFEKGYGKDSAGIAKEAINYARLNGFDCCLIDTSGRMQNNEPLMKELAKLIKENGPDLTLFVGEALVGNEAIDQLTKFNGALIDNGCKGVTENSSAINGIVLTKFDTIDDQVGAAVSMTYITGQPIVFVGVGQTYKDLKQLDARSVVKSLMR